MADINTILVPLDGSELAKQSLPFAQAVIGASGKLVLLRVLPIPEPMLDPAGREIVAVEVMARWDRELAEQDLKEAEERLRTRLPAGVSIERRIEIGDPTDETRNAAITSDADLIVITSHARGAIGRAAFGSVADHLSRTSTIPVLIIRPSDASVENEPPMIRRLLVPLDGSPRSQAALAVAKRLARQLAAPIHLLRVIDFSPMLYSNEPIALPQEYFDDWRRIARLSLENAAEPLQEAGIAVTTEIREGSPYVSIESACEEGDLIVLSSHGRSGIERWLLGSVAEKLVRAAPVPVCLVPAIAESEEAGKAPEELAEIGASST